MVEKTGSPSCGKRTQNDYSLAFKLQIIYEVEKGELTYKEAQHKYGIQGRSTVLVWLRKHGSLDWKSNSMKGKPSPQSKIRELERKIKRLEQEKIILNKAIDVADELFDTNIRKKYLPLSQTAFDSQGAARVGGTKAIASVLGYSRQYVYKQCKEQAIIEDAKCEVKKLVPRREIR